MMQTSPVITEEDIQKLSSRESFQRGEDYYSQGALSELVQQENVLRGYCEGSSYEPYRVTATLSERGIAHTGCTCPYDWGGICKHRVALLLAWVYEPESFESVPPLDELLAGRSKEELVLLIKEMIKRSPELARILELPVQPDRQTPLDLEAFRRQIGYALRQGGRYDYDYPDSGTVATELSSIVETAQRFQEGGDWENAGGIYTLILTEIVPRYENLYDDDGDIPLVLQECAEGLDSCLTEGEADTATRRTWLTRYTKQTGRLPMALELQREMVREQPRFETYKALRELAQQLGEWVKLRPEVVAELEAKQAWHVLVEIALDEKDVRWALALLSRPKNPWVLGGYELRVAQAAEADYPQAALQIYLPRVETLIQGRNRGSYHEAAALLVKIRALYQRQGQANVWQEYITPLREQHKRLPALMDELRKTGI